MNNLYSKHKKCDLILLKMNKMYSPIKGIMAFVFLIISCGKNYNKDYLKEGFINPPHSARPGVYWYFMNGNIERKAITADLELMKKLITTELPIHHRPLSCHILLPQ